MGMVWYLPTHYVTYPNKNKIRVVMDWAVKFKDRCLNEELFRGPKLIPSLIGVLLRTRQFRVAISADIESFYHRMAYPSIIRRFNASFLDPLAVRILFPHFR
jgi:hypothetical protein